jgi:hypothetical protein
MRLTARGGSNYLAPVLPERMQRRLALAALGDAMREMNAAIEEMLAEHDPLAAHIFVSRRLYQNMSDTKSSKRHHLSAQLSCQQACELGFRRQCLHLRLRD